MLRDNYTHNYVQTYSLLSYFPPFLFKSLACDSITRYVSWSDCPSVPVYGWWCSTAPIQMLELALFIAASAQPRATRVSGLVSSLPTLLPSFLHSYFPFFLLIQHFLPKITQKSPSLKCDWQTEMRRTDGNVTDRRTIQPTHWAMCRVVCRRLKIMWCHYTYGKIAEKSKMWQTDQPTDRPTDRQSGV